MQRPWNKRGYAGLVAAKYKWNAKHRNRQWALTEEETDALFQGECHYCGRPPSNVCRGVKYNGIDRKDNKLDYITGNVLSCCKLCNKLKGTMAYDVFVAHLKLIGQHLLQNC
jgi:hypothetical protein